MSKRTYNFQDILKISYWDANDCLFINMTEDYRKENAPFELDKNLFSYKRVDNVVYVGYRKDSESLIIYTTDIFFYNFKQTVNDARDNKNDWTMMELINLFESSPLFEFAILIKNEGGNFSLGSTYDVISCLYDLCDELDIPLVVGDGFKLESFDLNMFKLEKK